MFNLVCFHKVLLFSYSVSKQCDIYYTRDENVLYVSLNAVLKNKSMLSGQWKIIITNSDCEINFLFTQKYFRQIIKKKNGGKLISLYRPYWSEFKSLFQFSWKKLIIRLGALIRLIALSLSLDEIKTIFSLNKVVLSTEWGKKKIENQISELCGIVEIPFPVIWSVKLLYASNQ